LQSNIGENEKATVALERAVELNPQYSNARYFLGLSYFRVGRISEAIEQFTIVSNLNPDNEDVKTILNNLNLGENPFSPAEMPQQIDILPIEGE
jgi:tetratricopeptide (TPR) repeat protein